jgi:hypothetical protein
MLLDDNDGKEVGDYFYDNQVLEVLDGQKPS